MNDDHTPVEVLHASSGGGHIYSAPGGASVYRRATELDGTAELVAAGEFDMDSVGGLHRALADAGADGATSVRLDVSGVVFGDTSVIHALLRARQGLGRLVLVPPQLRQLFDLTDTTPLFPVET
ncbi:STAS domain-containing protein [Streptomyces sp. NPDC047972]|uniref:STAS domain-containing protein n=1 Tax=Streptomyces sp. NPDC047972 TaxID=3365493 RepID=UPI003714A6A0